MACNLTRLIADPPPGDDWKPPKGRGRSFCDLPRWKAFLYLIISKFRKPSITHQNL
jgi:hypothetical protein